MRIVSCKSVMYCWFGFYFYYWGPQGFHVRHIVLHLAACRVGPIVVPKLIAYILSAKKMLHI